MVKRGGKREFDHTQAQVIKNAAGGDIQLYKTINESGTEVELHCHYEAREAKERAMLDSAMQRFETALQAMSYNLAKP